MGMAWQVRFAHLPCHPHPLRSSAARRRILQMADNATGARYTFHTTNPAFVRRSTPGM